MRTKNSVIILTSHSILFNIESPHWSITNNLNILYPYYTYEARNAEAFLFLHASVSTIIYKEIHEELTTAVPKESRIINRIWTSAWPHERDGQACDSPSVRRKSTKGREKQGGETNVGIKEEQRNSRPPFFFPSTFPREANRVKADVLETKLDPSDPSQLEFRFTRKLESGLRLLHLAVLPFSPSPLPRSTILNSSIPLQFGFLRYLLNSAILTVASYYAAWRTSAQRTKFWMKRFRGTSRKSHDSCALFSISWLSSNYVKWNRIPASWLGIISFFRHSASAS